MQSNKRENIDLFMDKISHSASVIMKESQLVGEYASLMYRLNQNYLDRKNIGESSVYGRCWHYAHELFLWLECNKLKDYSEESEENKESVQRMKDIKRRYESPEETVSLEDLTFFVQKVREVISWAGYHSDERNVVDHNTPDFASDELEI